MIQVFFFYNNKNSKTVTMTLPKILDHEFVQDIFTLNVRLRFVMYKTIYVINIIIYMCSQHSNVL